MEKNSIFKLIDELRGRKLTVEEKFYEDFKSYLAGRFLILRKKYNLTRDQLAHKLNISLKDVELIESGEKILSVDEVVDLLFKLFKLQ